MRPLSGRQQREVVVVRSATHLLVMSMNTSSSVLAVPRPPPAPPATPISGHRQWQSCHRWQSWALAISAIAAAPPPPRFVSAVASLPPRSLTPRFRLISEVDSVTVEGGKGGCSCHACLSLNDHRPSHPYNAGTEHVGCSPIRQILLAPSAKRGEVLEGGA